MDDPMTRSRLDRANGTRPLGEPGPKRVPRLSLAHNSACLRFATYLIPPTCHDLDQERHDNCALTAACRALRPSRFKISAASEYVVSCDAEILRPTSQRKTVHWRTAERAEGQRETGKQFRQS